MIKIIDIRTLELITTLDEMPDIIKFKEGETIRMTINEEPEIEIYLPPVAYAHFELENVDDKAFKTFLYNLRYPNSRN